MPISFQHSKSFHSGKAKYSSWEETSYKHTTAMNPLCQNYGHCRKNSVKNHRGTHLSTKRFSPNKPMFFCWKVQRKPCKLPCGRKKQGHRDTVIFYAQRQRKTPVYTDPTHVKRYRRNFFWFSVRAEDVRVRSAEIHCR